MIGALRAVQDGLLEFESIRPHSETVLSISLDTSANHLNDLLTVKQIAAVLHRPTSPMCRSSSTAGGTRI